MVVTAIAQTHRRRAERNEFDAHVERGRLDHQILTDAVTGLYTRAQFLRASGEEMERSRRYGQHFTTSCGPRDVTVKLGFTELTSDMDNILEAFAQAGTVLDAAKQSRS